MTWAMDPIERKVYAGFLISAIVMAVLATVTYRKADAILEGSREVYRIHHVLVRLDQVIEQESIVWDLQQAFLARGRTEDLGACQEALFQIDQWVGEIRQLSAQEKDQTLRVSELEALVAEQIKVIANAIQRRQTLGPKAVVQHLDRAASLRAFKGLEVLLKGFKARETMLMEAHERALDGRSSQVLGLMVFGLLLCGLIFVLIHRQNHREMLRRKAAEEALRASAMHDPLTHAYNRRQLDASFAEQLSAAQRNQRPLGVVMLDIDHFKGFNDRHGHAAGDAVLIQVSNAISTTLRPEDLLFRFGGEEFTLLLPGADLEDSIVAAERARLAVGALLAELHGHALGRISISLGAACYPQTALTEAELLQQADEALYHAKRSGRDQIVAWRPGVSPDLVNGASSS